MPRRRPALPPIPVPDDPHRGPYRWPTARRVLNEMRPAGELYLSSGDGRTCGPCGRVVAVTAGVCPCGRTLRPYDDGRPVRPGIAERFDTDGAFALTRDEWRQLMPMRRPDGRYYYVRYVGPYVPVTPDELPAFARHA